MNGIIIVDKPQDFTSFDVVAKMRGICQMKKIGHGGTLDPMATGVLPVFLGQATKAMDLQPDQTKTYDAVLQLGILTDTGDITGEILEEKAVTVGEQALMETIPAFWGVQQQLPPLYSAVKVNGKPLYRYAREGKPVERKPRTVEIIKLEYAGQVAENQYRLVVQCSKGTYIRSLVEDMAQKLGTIGTLAALRRTQAGVYTEKEAYTLDEIQQAKTEGRLEQLVRPVEEVFAGIPPLELTDADAKRLLNGAPVYGQKLMPGQYQATAGGTFLGLVAMQPDGILAGQKLFVERTPE